MGRDVAKPKVALIGRPNVGKSTLFNRLIGANARRGGRAAIVDELAGVTRDRLYGTCEWDGYEFTVIDCGGIGEESEDPLWEPVADNSRHAMAEADLVLFLTDVRTGLTISDDAVLKELRRVKKPVIVAVNKVEHEVHEPAAYEFYKLGYSDVVFISALSGRRVGELLDLVVQRLDWTGYEQATPAFIAFRYEEEAPAGTPGPEAGRGGGGVDEADAADGAYPFAWAESGESRFVPDESWRNTAVQLVFVGRQNVGKSSLTNALLGQERALVADLPGTTRDPLACRFERDGQAYELLDTAGMKRVTRMKEDVDYYSLIRAEKSLRGSEVALLTIDASEGVMEQDKRVASKIAEMKRSVVVVVNKADLLIPPEEVPDTPAEIRRNKRRERPASPDEAMRKAHLQYVRHELDQLRWAEVIYTSAVTGEGIPALLHAACRSRENFHRRLDNTAIRTVLNEAITLNPPPVVKNRELRFHDFRQIGNCPPAFLIEVNDKLIMRGAYLRFLENTLRKHFPLEGTHIELVLYEKRRQKK